MTLGGQDRCRTTTVTPSIRMLVAQAQARDLVLVSRDPALEPYDVQILRA